MLVSICFSIISLSFRGKWYNIFKFGQIVHEIGHAIGFYHEMSRGDRDSFIRINLQNIIDPVNNFYNFANFGSEIESNNLGIQYDLSSIMHYDSTVSNIDALLFDSDIFLSKAYGINGSQTMQSLDPNLQFLMGQRAGLSFYDIKMACIGYKCSGLKEDFIKVLRNIKLYFFRFLYYSTNLSK